MHVQEAQHWVFSRLWKLPGIWLHEYTAYAMWRWWRWWYCVLINVIRWIVSIDMCLIYYSRHGAMMNMMILRTYKCNSLHCFDSNVCLTYYSCHVAMMNMMILRTYKCNSLHCFDSNMCLTMYTMWFSIMFIYRLSDVELWRVAKDR